MAISTTSRFGLTRWSADSDPFEREAMDENMRLLEAQGARFTQGTLADRPAPGKQGTFYRVSDANADRPTLFYDTGGAWMEIRPDLSAFAKTLDVGNALGLKASTIYVDQAIATRVPTTSDQLILDLYRATNQFILGSGAGEYGGPNISGLRTIDGSPVQANETVLLFGQVENVDGPPNGVYVTSAQQWTRLVMPGLVAGNARGRYARVIGGTFRGMLFAGEGVGSGSTALERWGRVFSGANANRAGTAPLLEPRTSDPAGYHPKMSSTVQGFVGQVVYWPAPASLTPPAGWAYANGQLLLRASYPALYSVLGHRFSGGVDPGNGQFKLPTAGTINAGDGSGQVLSPIICLGAA